LPKDPRVLVDHGTLDDAGVYAFGRGEALVQTVDFFTPVVDDPYDFGQIAAANSLSDVYAMGGKPITALGLVCFPDEKLPSKVLREILRGGQAKLKEAGASLLGGHTVRDAELKFGYAVTGVVKRRQLMTNAGARAGDRLLLTKPLGTGILSTVLKAGRLEATLVRRMTRSMAALNRRAAEVAVEFRARAATDITGYGLIGHARQVADASHVTLRIRPTAKWFFPRTLEFAAEGMIPGGGRKNREFYSKGMDVGDVSDAMLDALHDPQTSGGLLLSVPARRWTSLTAALRRRRVWMVDVGVVEARGRSAIVLEGP
jgi:selenide,water dikinase